MLFKETCYWAACMCSKASPMQQFIYVPTCLLFFSFWLVDIEADGPCCYLGLGRHCPWSLLEFRTTMVIDCQVFPTLTPCCACFRPIYYSLQIPSFFATRFNCLKSTLSISHVLWKSDTCGFSVNDNFAQLSWMGSYGHRSMKPSAIWGTMWWTRLGKMIDNHFWIQLVYYIS